MSTVQRNSWELTDVFDRAIPGQAVIQIRHYPQVNAISARFIEYVLNDATFTLRGEEYLVYELLAGELKESVESADYVACAGCDAG